MAKYRDIDYRLKTNSIGNIVLNEDDAVIHQSIKTILSTIPGERYMLPEFGSRIRDILFEPMDAITNRILEIEIEDALAKWEDRMSITYVNVVSDYDRNEYDVEIGYVIEFVGRSGVFEGTLKSYV